MGFYRVLSGTVRGLSVEFVRVEADVSNGLPLFHMVGYLSSEVKEAAERVRAAIRNAGFLLPARKIVVNLSPASVKKRGTSFDLPIAAAVLCALQAIPEERFRETLVLGELGLDGRVRPVDGVLPMVAEAQKRGVRTCILPVENMREGHLAGGVRILGVRSLAEICDWAAGKRTLSGETGEAPRKERRETDKGRLDFADICGQEGVKRATLVAVAGNHNLLYVGPPGAGKTMLAERIPTILPELTRKESLEITKIYSIVGLLRKEQPLVTERPFRKVHHAVTRAALVGGGHLPTPGEVTLAHRGVLFLDELAEFRREVLESLRQPLEERCVHLARQGGSYCFPADFMLVAAMNPCPCGNYPDRERCVCTHAQIQAYMGKLSQPFLDRLDLCIDAPGVAYEDLAGERQGSSSARMRRMVETARRRQEERFRDTAGVCTNAQMGQAELREHCRLGTAGERLMQQAYDVLHLTARSYHRILRVARTIADLEEAEQIQEDHIREALAYRMMDKRQWGG